MDAEPTDDGAAAVHTAILPVELYERVQAAIVARKTRASTSRGKRDEPEDPFLLRGLLVCEECGRAMTTSMSTALTKKTAPKAPRYYRCRTEGCDGGQIAASDVEGMVLDAPRSETRERAVGHGLVVFAGMAS